MNIRQDPTRGITAAIAAALGIDASAHDPARALRLLAALKPVLRELTDAAASSIGSSQVRAAAFISLTEDLYRIAGYGQVLAAARATAADLHTITEAPLAQLNALLADPADFLRGARDLPADETNRPGRKPLYRDEAEFLKNQHHLTHFQATHRLRTAGNLLPGTGFNGKPVPPKFPELGKVFGEAVADPRTVAGLAVRLEAMAPEIARQPDPASTARALDAELAAAVRTRDAKGTDRLVKDQQKRLNAGVVQRREDQESRFTGLTYLGHTHKGYEYLLVTDAEGHELLATAADILNNPKTPAGTPPVAGPAAAPAQVPAQGPAQGPADGPRPIPEWAIGPSTPEAQRPVEGFGIPAGPAPWEPGVEPLPGETPDEARARQRAARLHRFVIDSIRIIAASPGRDPRKGKQARSGDAEPGTSEGDMMPMPPHVMLAVTIDFKTLTGELENAGVTDHGQDISAATCRRLACNAGIIPVVLDGNGVPLELGRTRRYFNRAQRRAIAVRDRGCCNPGCSMPVNRTEAHHIDEWSAGGRTDVSRGCLLCVRCHVDHHAGHFRIVMLNGLPHVIKPPSMDPRQVPRRNWIFHPAAQPAAA